MVLWAGTEATVQTVHAPCHQASNHFDSYFGREAVFPEPFALFHCQWTQRQGRKRAGSWLLFTQFLTEFPGRAHSNSQERLVFECKLLCRGLRCSLLHGEDANSLLRCAWSSVMPL